MKDQIIYILIGGGIAIISSIFAQIGEFIRKSLEEKRKIKFDLEDKKNQSKNRVIARRLDQIEDLATKTTVTINSLIQNYPKIIKAKTPIAHLHDQLSEFLNNNYLVPLAIILGDKDITNAVTNFGIIYSEIFDLITKLGAEKKIDEDELLDKYQKFEVAYIRIIEFLDKYRIENL